jgi:hypothetical protein
MHPGSGHSIPRVNPSRREASSFQAASRIPFAGGAPIMQECDLLLTRTPTAIMKRLSVIAFLTLALLLLKPAIAQTPASAKETEELKTLISDVQAQQKEIAENQAKIDAKLATLSETIREARIFSSRAGH